MSTSANQPARLASEDVIISAPMSYAGSAQRILRLRRRADSDVSLVALTVTAVAAGRARVGDGHHLVPHLGLLLVPYRLLRRGARKRKMEALRHRELLGTIQGSAAASAAAFVGATAAELIPPKYVADELVADSDRELTVDELRGHLIAGRLTAEEFEERVSAAQKARKRADLDAATIHLPRGTR